jgi:hypothetical protein
MKPYEIDTKTEKGKNLVSILMHPKNLVRFKNFGPDSYIRVQTDKPIDPTKPRLYISFFASAGDEKNSRERLHKFEQPSREFGQILSHKLNSLDDNIEILLSTGGCPHIGDWATQEIRKLSPRATLVAIYPSSENIVPELRTDPSHLGQYHYVVHPDMEVYMRCCLVGTSDLAFLFHGGDGSLVESGYQLGQEGILAVNNFKHSLTGVAKGIVETLKKNYKHKKYVFFRNSDPGVLIERAFVEYEAKVLGLQDRLSAVVVYKHMHKPQDSERDCILINFRKCELPVTYYHRGREHEPAEQVLVKDLTSEQLFDIFKTSNNLDQELLLVQPKPQYERPNIYKADLSLFGSSYHDGQMASWMNKFKHALNSECDGAIFYSRFFEDNHT